ncbi:SURF1 family protein [Roseococcus sp. DSY-14]|uniref:SURF1 family protein n=1 Tax=Roseococcus sp. DSY-14 TaxID=3369650 RepID=UPI00387AB627
MSGEGEAGRAGRPWRALILPSFLALPVLALLLGLGAWQVQRLHWKNGVLAALAAAQALPPSEAGPDPVPFAPITATGRFRPGAEGFLGLEVRGSALGGTLVAVLDRAGAPPLLVLRGWAPFEGGRVERPEGPVILSGYARPADRRNPFAPADDPAARRFYQFDPARIAAALGAPDAPPYALAVVLPGRAVPGGFGAAPAPARAALPDPATGIPAPNNPHLGYALTWFGLALGWVAIFLLWCRRRLREPA